MKIIPLPKKILEVEGVFIFEKGAGISCPFKNIRAQFNEFLLKTAKFSLVEGREIVFLIDGNLKIKPEGYVLEISSGITVKALDENGLFYGMQTLKQIIYAYLQNGRAVIPRMNIEDEPRFSYRGFMFDCCRHFFGVDVVKRYIDVCAMHKLNVFHWHLTEDQGWRIQIDKYPKLTEIGSKRKETRGDKKPIEGFFTKQQITEIVKYASDRYIEVIPEFDMPGHTRAVLASYPELGCTGKSFEVATHFGVHQEILCAGEPKTYEFIYDVLDEMAKLFPSKYVHLGGDEAIKTEWAKCPKCNAKVKEVGLKNVEQLQGYMTKCVVEHLETLGKVAICWNECINSGILDESAVMQYWQDGKKPLRVLNAVNSGRKTIISKFVPYYLDYPYGMTSLSNTYKFEPIIEGLDAAAEINIIGVEAPLWTEYVKTIEKADYQIFPRLTAVAESAWTVKENKNYSEFCRRYSQFDKLLKREGFNGATLAESNPCFIKGKIELIKFGIDMYDRDNIKRSKLVVKEIRKTRKEAARDI
ncbi:MAG: beta-N-acetylhexosaminidase [Clostridia bacterium]